MKVKIGFGAVLIWLVAGYLLVGIRKLLGDMGQPPFNRPKYLHDGGIGGKIRAVLAWPLLWCLHVSTAIRTGRKRTANMKAQLPVASSYLIAAVVVLAAAWLLGSAA